MKRLAWFMALASVACTSSSSSPAVSSDAGSDDAASGDAGQDGGGSDGAPVEAGAGLVARGARYCEILVANVAGTDVQAKVYSTLGLNDCPDDLWGKLDPEALKSKLGATMVVLNGPRYWMIDAASGSLQDPTVVDFGGIAMRQAGAITVPTAQASTLQKAYSEHVIQRNSHFTWNAGLPVFELVGPGGDVYTMQSYSVQKVGTLTQAQLPSLGASLALPTGWSYRTRTLTTQLDAVATTGTARVVQDDDENTYVRTQ